MQLGLGQREREEFVMVEKRHARGDGQILSLGWRHRVIDGQQTGGGMMLGERFEETAADESGGTGDDETRLEFKGGSRHRLERCE